MGPGDARAGCQQSHSSAHWDMMAAASRRGFRRVMVRLTSASNNGKGRQQIGPGRKKCPTYGRENSLIFLSESDRIPEGNTRRRCFPNVGHLIHLM
jgi:hypothetical protein